MVSHRKRCAKIKSAKFAGRKVIRVEYILNTIVELCENVKEIILPEKKRRGNIIDKFYPVCQAFSLQILQ